MAYTEFCCRSGGSNLNAGTRTGNSTEPGTAAFKTYTSGTWVQATRTFTPAGGANPTTDGIAVGDFVSVYPDAATVSPYVARITTVGATTFVTDATAKAGTAPVDGALVTSASIGGAWKGPNAAENFPFGFIKNALNDGTNLFPRVNFKDAASFAVTAAITHSLADTQVVFQGYTTAYGDSGRGTISGSGAASFALLTFGGTNSGNVLQNMILDGNGGTGSAAGLTLSSSSIDRIYNCVIKNMAGAGVLNSSSFTHLDTVEIFGCNINNTANTAGINVSSGTVMLGNSISHHNAGSNTDGLYTAAGSYAKISAINSIFDTNGRHGVNLSLASSEIGEIIINCDFYANGTHGLNIASESGYFSHFLIASCNFVLNGGYGVSCTTQSSIGVLQNCGFADNVSGESTLVNIVKSASQSYGAGNTPWVDPANGDFRINRAAAINGGRGTFVQTKASYAGAIGYPDIGAAQHLESGGAAGMLFIPNMDGT